MNFGAEHIKQLLQKNLPGATSHQKMLPPGRTLATPSTEKEKIKYSSVMLALFEENNTLFGCLIKRPKHMKHHASQIALPGGRIEKEENPVRTALRETFEEIGILPEDVEILGSLSELYVEVSRFIIHPVIGWMNKKPTFSVNQYEVEKIVLFPLLNYKDNIEEIEVDTIVGKMKVPCIKFEDEIIWGATAMILSEFYDILKEGTALR
jgi:8-oxo-dGTP pyrophosphatase MutT (NUDIX family)